LRFLLANMKREVDVIAHPDIWAPKFARVKNKPDRYIGIPYMRSELESLGARFVLTSEPFSLTEHIMTTGQVPMVTDFEKIDSFLFVKTADGFVADALLDDLALVIKTQMGLVVALGCAHRGMINTLYHARKVSGTQKIHLGGCHLQHATDEQIWQTISALNEMGVQKLGVSHCTGTRATLLMAQTYGDDFVFNNTGNVIELA
jgi:7,8-dihydropterin-6-yl-methyl-4-(beta-D-ribofuranosyl)aminobenzene 5'-phosphate synthase